MEIYLRIGSILCNCNFFELLQLLLDLLKGGMMHDTCYVRFDMWRQIRQQRGRPTRTVLEQQQSLEKTRGEEGVTIASQSPLNSAQLITRLCTTCSLPLHCPVPSNHFPIVIAGRGQTDRSLASLVLFSLSCLLSGYSLPIRQFFFGNLGRIFEW